MLLTESEVTGCILLIAFPQKEKIAGCLYSVSKKGKGKYQLNFFILYFRQFDNCNILSFFQAQLFLIGQVSTFQLGRPFPQHLCMPATKAPNLSWKSSLLFALQEHLSSCQKPRQVVYCAIQLHPKHPFSDDF